MRNIRKNKHTKLYIIIPVALGMLLVGAVLYFGKNIYLPAADSKSQLTEQQQDQESSAAIEAKRKAIEDANNPDSQPKPSPVPTSSEGITLSAKTDDNNTIIIYTQLKEFASGSCEIIITNNQKTYTSVTQILYQPQYSICQGYSVPISSLGTGTWHIILNVTPTNGNALTKSIDYEAI